MKKIIKSLAIILAMSSMLTNVVANADELANDTEVVASSVENVVEFTDMPDDWTTVALKNAVKNGLLNGYDGKVMPYDNITRAQMAAIIVRALGADTMADISAFSDVTEDKWYYAEFSKAVYMKAFQGTDDGKLNPENFITFEECFIVVSRIFDLAAADIKSLDGFEDGAEVADWAKEAMAKVVGNGYWDGVDGKLKPKSYITRQEFAVLMDNLVKTYINEPGEYEEFGEGNILIRSENVTIKGLETDDLIIIGDGVQGETHLTDIKSTNDIVCRGGTMIATGIVNNVSGMVSGIVLDLQGINERTGKIYIGAPDIQLKLGEVQIRP